MTEEQWVSATDPGPMLEYLVGKASDRKLRLFACACCRRIWHLLPDAGRNAIGFTERIADDQTGSVPHLSGRLRARGAAKAAAAAAIEHLTRNNVAAAIRDAALAAGIHAADAPGSGVDWAAGRDAAIAAERKKQSGLLRDILGNPFRPVPTFDPRWFGWNEGAILRLARDVYQERRFERLAILADMLEESGYPDRQFIEHCRKRGSHARGCWALDAILGLA